MANQFTNLWTEQDEEFLRENYKNLSIKEVAMCLKRSPSAVTAMAFELGLTEPQWTAQEEQIVADNFSKMEARDIKKRFLSSRTVPAIRRKARSLGVISLRTLQPRLHLVNDDFFSVPSVKNSYWAGFLAADGCIAPGQGTNQKKNTIVLAISKVDLCVLEEFKRQTQWDGTVTEFKNSAGKPMIAAQINSPRWIIDLKENFNIVPQKSLILTPPNLTDRKLIDAFIVGYIDGDGCVTKSGKYINLNALGTKPLLLWIKSRYKEILDFHKIEWKAKAIIPKKKIFSLSAWGKKANCLINHFNQVPLDFRLVRKWYRYPILIGDNNVKI